MNKMVKTELLHAMRVFLAASSEVSIIGGVLTSPFAPDIVYRNGLCVNFTHGYDLCPPNMLVDLQRAEVAYRTHERSVSPDEIRSLWYSVAPREETELLIMPNINIQNGERGFLSPIDTLVRKKGETHVHSYEGPMVALDLGKHDEDGWAEWVAANYYSQGDDNFKFELLRDSATHFTRANGLARKLLAQRSMTRATIRSRPKSVRRYLKDTVEEISAPLLWDGEGVVSKKTIAENTSESMVMLMLNVFAPR